MGKRFLIDTNILVYFLGGDFNNTQKNYLSDIIEEEFNISFVTKIELLGWKKHTDNSFQQASLLVENAYILNVSEEIINKTIDLKRLLSIKLPDALIAATCLVHHLTLLTRNKSDFERIANLEVINPFEI